MSQDKVEGFQIGAGVKSVKERRKHCISQWLEEEVGVRILTQCLYSEIHKSKAGGSMPAMLQALDKWKLFPLGKTNASRFQRFTVWRGESFISSKHQLNILDTKLRV